MSWLEKEGLSCSSDSELENGSDDSSTECNESLGIWLKILPVVGTGFSIFAYPWDSVSLVKTRIAFQEGIPQSEQVLLKGEKVLKEGTLESLGITRESNCLRLITQMSTGTSLPPTTAPLKLPKLFDKNPDLDNNNVDNLNNNETMVEKVLLFRGDDRVFVIIKKRVNNNNNNNSPPKHVEPQLDRIRENARTLKKMNEIRGRLSKEREEVSPAQPKKASAAPSRTINSSVSSLNRIKAEIYLQSKRDDYFPGQLPYTHAQLGKYVQLKINILLSQINSENDENRFIRSHRSHGLTPTVVLNRKSTHQKSSRKKTARLEESKLNTNRQPTAALPARRIDSGRIIRISRPGTGGIKKKVRCEECRKKLGVACRYECRCGKLFCSTHRYAEAHNCTFDYKAEGRRLLKQANPRVVPSKVTQI